VDTTGDEGRRGNEIKREKHRQQVQWKEEGGSITQSWTNGLWTVLHWKQQSISLSPVSLIPTLSRFPVVHSVDFFGKSRLFVVPDAVLLRTK